MAPRVSLDLELAWLNKKKYFMIAIMLNDIVLPSLCCAMWMSIKLNKLRTKSNL
jgi:hypothetical protein